MHELSIVLSIVDIVEQQLKAAAATQVERIELEIGELAGIEQSALDFAWEAAVKDTALEQAERHIHHLAGKARCQSCGHTFPVHQLYDLCPRCQHPVHDILQGRELRVRSLTVN